MASAAQMALPSRLSTVPMRGAAVAVQARIGHEPRALDPAPVLSHQIVADASKDHGT